QVRVLTEKDREQWDTFVASHDGGQILQSWEWGEFKSKLGWDHFVLAAEDGGGIKTGISILSRKLPLLKRTLFYAPRGPVGAVSDPELLNMLVDGVCVEASLRMPSC
ncbi:MAG: peptidoglycan bridge formation glycyltransferase FemA/FemB family protein, partial [bacterium]